MEKCSKSVVHCGAVVADAPSPLSTPRSAAGQAQLRLGKPLRMKCRASPVLLFMRAGRVVAGTVGIVRATVPFHGEHDAPEPTKDGLRFSTVRLPTPRCVCVSVNLFSLSLAATAAAVCAASPGPPCSGGCRVPASRALPLPALAFNDQRPVVCALAWRGVGGRGGGRAGWGLGGARRWGERRALGSCERARRAGRE